MSDERLHIGGYHGTDDRSAAQIAESGFNPANGDVFFAPLDNLIFAQNHGARRASDRGDTTYTVVQGIFPGRKLEFGLGGDQLKVPADQASRIGVVALHQFDLQGRRIPPPTTREVL